MTKTIDGRPSCPPRAITTDSAEMGGVLCLRGLRIPAATVVQRHD